jgi:hypothetical protein
MTANANPTASDGIVVTVPAHLADRVRATASATVLADRCQTLQHSAVYEADVAEQFTREQWHRGIRGRLGLVQDALDYVDLVENAISDGQDTPVVLQLDWAKVAAFVHGVRVKIEMAADVAKMDAKRYAEEMDDTTAQHVRESAARLSDWVTLLDTTLAASLEASSR